LQGTRDPFGSREEVEGYGLSSAVTVHWLEDGDHDFRPRKTSGRTTEQNWQEAIAAVVAFVEHLSARLAWAREHHRVDRRPGHDECKLNQFYQAFGVERGYSRDRDLLALPAPQPGRQLSAKRAGKSL
jgi:hypothetical protein